MTVSQLRCISISHTLSSLVACGVTINSQEAYVKALGRGFSGAPFKTLTIRFNGVTGESVRRLNDLKSEENVRWKKNRESKLRLAGSHYTAICTEKYCAAEGKRNTPVKLTVWKTIPFLEDGQVSGTDDV